MPPERGKHWRAQAQHASGAEGGSVEAEAGKEAGSGMAHGGACGSDYLVRLGMDPLCQLLMSSHWTVW